MSEQEALILKSVEVLRRTASEVGDTTLDGLLNIMHSGSLDMNCFKVAVRRVRDY